MADTTYKLPTLEDITETAIAYQAALIPEDDLSRHSDEWARVRVVCLVAADVDYHGQIQRLDANPGTATGNALDEWGKAADALRKGPTGARGADALRIRGAVGTAYTVGLTLTHASGARYSLEDGGVMPADEFVDVTIAATEEDAKSTGARTRLEAGQILRFDDPPVGLEQNAQLVADLTDGGEDAELDPAYRPRVVDVWKRPRMGNAVADWQRWALEVTGVARAEVYRNRAGLGLIDVAGMAAGSGEARALTAPQRAELLAHLVARHPGGATPRVLETLAEPADVRVLVEPVAGVARFAPDWNTDGVAYTVSAWNPTTLVLKLSANRPASLKAGHRVVVDTGNGAEVVVKSLGPAADEITIREVPAGWTSPSGGEDVLPGGPLVAPVRAAVEALIDSLGPALGGYGAGWKGALTRADLNAATQAVEGVHDSEPRTLANAPWVKLEATEYLHPLDDAIGFLKPGRIVVVYSDEL